MVITEEDLIKFANDPQNNIEKRQCDTNAIKVFTKYQGEIQMGMATYINCEKEKSDVPHIWNVLRSTSESGKEVEKIIDIINYKINIGGQYKGHRDGVITSKEELEKIRKITRDLLNA